MGDRARELLLRFWATVKTPRGLIAVFFAVALAQGAAESTSEQGKSGLAAVGEIAFALVIGWLIAYWLQGWFKRWWERRSRPGTPQFARPTQSAGSRTQLREDKNARFFMDRSGFLWRKRYWFVGTGCPPVEYTAEDIEILYVCAKTKPEEVASLPPRTWWLYDQKFYWENSNYSSQDVKALLLQREREERRRLDRAHALMAMESEGVVIRREGISREVKQAVFERDGGRCAECGSPGPLEFDHIIPVAFGGATTAKNIQLLCLDCNRKKGASL